MQRELTTYEYVTIRLAECSSARTILGKCLFIDKKDRIFQIVTYENIFLKSLALNIKDL